VAFIRMARLGLESIAGRASPTDADGVAVSEEANQVRFGVGGGAWIIARQSPRDPATPNVRCEFA